MNLNTKIRELISQYTTNLITLTTFREQFVLFYQDAIRSNPETIVLSKTVEMFYGDLVAGEYDEVELRKKLSTLPPLLEIPEKPSAAEFVFQFFQFTPLSASTTLASSGSRQEIAKATVQPIPCGTHA